MHPPLSVGRTRSAPIRTLAASGALALAVACAGALPTGANAQKLIKCVDKQGRVTYVDKLGPECANDQGFQEMNKRGVVTKKIDAPLTAEQRKAQEDEVAQKKVEATKLAEQRRQDKALLATYTNEKEIDLKRERDYQVIDAAMGTVRTSLKGATERLDDVNKRMAAASKDKKAPSDALKEEATRAQADKVRLEQQVKDKEAEREATKEKYDQYKKRFMELRSGVQAAK